MSESEQGMVFGEESLVLKQIPITMGKARYILREADGDTACRYQNANLERVQYSNDGKLVNIRGGADVQPFLISLCLFETDEKGEVRVSDHTKKEMRVSIETIRKWPNPVMRRLFNWVKENSDLGEEEETVEKLRKKLEEAEKKEAEKKEAAKNDESFTTVGTELPLSSGTTDLSTD